MPFLAVTRSRPDATAMPRESIGPKHPGPLGNLSYRDRPCQRVNALRNGPGRRIQAPDVPGALSPVSVRTPTPPFPPLALPSVLSTLARMSLGHAWGG